MLLIKGKFYGKLCGFSENPAFIKENLHDICASVQSRIVSILINKLKKAAKETGLKQIAIAGGVSANSELRQTLSDLKEELGWTTFVPHIQYCTDNAAMIAVSGYYKYLDGEFADQLIAPTARYKI